jgi:hypothetical protein
MLEHDASRGSSNMGRGLVRNVKFFRPSLKSNFEDSYQPDQ